MNGWFERHIKVNSKPSQESQDNLSSSSPYFSEEKKKNIPLPSISVRSKSSSAAFKLRGHLARRYINEQNNLKKNQPNKNEIYPVSLYSVQNRKYENFARSIRQRNDTFYYVSFRRVQKI